MDVRSVAFTENVEDTIAGKGSDFRIVRADSISDEVCLERAITAVLEDELPWVLVVIVVGVGEEEIKMTITVEIRDLQTVWAVQVVSDDCWHQLRPRTDAKPPIVLSHDGHQVLAACTLRKEFSLAVFVEVGSDDADTLVYPV